jgi:hypothetical protein
MTKVTDIVTNIDLDNCEHAICGGAVGVLSYDFLKKFMIVGTAGVKYYGEAHLSPWNAWIHTLCMPFTIYGMLYWIPALFNLQANNAKKVMTILYHIYGGHYIKVNKVGALMYYIWYYNVLQQAKKNYTLDRRRLDKKDDKTNSTRNYLLKKGLCFSGYGLIYQEVFGHMIGGDIASRPEGILNAIVYAMYFSANHMY